MSTQKHFLLRAMLFFLPICAMEERPGDTKETHAQTVFIPVKNLEPKKAKSEIKHHVQAGKNAFKNAQQEISAMKTLLEDAEFEFCQAAEYCFFLYTRDNKKYRKQLETARKIIEKDLYAISATRLEHNLLYTVPFYVNYVCDKLRKIEAQLENYKKRHLNHESELS